MHMKKYDFKKIEKKWQSVWKSKKTFAAKDDSKKPKWYTLVEFPYPSGAGMHVGHVRSYTALDVVSRKRRMEGYNVLYPMGWDAFGLPTENYAIKTGVAPQVATKKNTDNFRKQLQSLGYSFDWNREVNTTDPDYYRWTQWIFQQFFKKGLAYKSKMAINWCPKDKIGLANEEVVNGKCERCGTAVEQRQKEQWMLKITAYADKLLEGLKDVNYLPEIKAQQENWIGRSEGAEIDFALAPSVVASTRSNPASSSVRVFTTRPDTLFGATYLVLAPEHELLTIGKLHIANSEEVAAYIAQTKLKSDLDRTSDGKEKTGVELKGVKAINPATKEEVPVWIGDYVLATYGTGAIMAVPAHDERDFAFAKKYQLPIKEVIEPLVDDASGKDAVRPGLPVKKRDCVICIVKHWNEDKYLCLRWKKMPWGTFVVGGVETGEDEMTAAAREIIEESGYTSAKFIRRIDGAVRSRFYHELKNENRDGRYQGLYFELVNDSRQLLDEKEAAIHEMLWVSRAEVEKFLTSEDFKIIWRRLFSDSHYSGTGLLVNSGKFDGMKSDEAKKAITEFVGGKTTVKYKLRDWVFSRQRYWGEPIPLVNCEMCGWVLVPEKELPIKLPKVAKYEPTDTGESPLSLMPKWVNTKCPECKGPAKRETDTMPNWAGSSWYFLRYCDPTNSKQFADSRKLSYWQPVDWYNGGMEHVTLHLLYSRFWNLFLFDLGLVPTKEPYKKRTAHGMILASDGKKMSKSVGNVVNPDDLVKEFGGDALRLYELFVGPFDQAVQWDPRGILGTARFLEKVWRIGSVVASTRSNPSFASDSKLSSLLNKTIQKVGADIEAANFNTAVSAMMIFVNELTADNLQLTVQDWQKFLSILSPFAPHIAEELWVIAKGKALLCEQAWPKVDEASIAESTYELIIQVNSKVRATFDVKKGTSQAEVEKLVSEIPEMQKWLTAPVKRVIFVKDRLINFIV
jgi:leucyl-tRNA synthetase